MKAMDDFDIPLAIPEGYLSFDDWKLVGRHVVKGSKASWIMGMALFHRDQTEPTDDVMEDDEYDLCDDDCGLDWHDQF